MCLQAFCRKQEGESMSKDDKTPKKINFTKRAIDSLELPERGQEFVWDIKLKSFGIRLTPTKKTYIVQNRVGRKTRRITLGDHVHLTVHRAREMAQEEMFKMLKGVDPSLEKKKEKAASITLQNIAENYMTHKKTRSGHFLKESTKKDIRKHLKGVFSDWANLPIASITEENVVKRFREASKRSAAQANQAFRILRALYNYARAASKSNGKPTLPENPVNVLSDSDDKKWNFVPERTGQIPENKIGIAWNLIHSLRTAQEQTTISRTLADFVAFLLLTGARFNEAARLTWDRIDFENETWFLPDSKNRQSIHFPLSSQALEILKERPRINEYVFFSYSKTGHVTDARHQMKKISDEIERKITAHDLRRTFRAVAAACGIELWRTKLLMNHTMREDITIRAYTEKGNLKYLAPDIQRIGDYIERQGTLEANKIIDLGIARKNAPK
jgi:integrase